MGREINILLVTGIYPPDIGGPATYTKKLSEELKDKNIRYHILTLGQGNDPNITYIPKEWHFIKRILFIKDFIERRKYSTIYVQDPFSVGFGVALSKTKAKKVMKIVGDNVWEISRELYGITDGIDKFQVKRYTAKIRALKRIQCYSASKMDQIITPSNYLKTIVQEWGVNRDIKVIYNAVKINIKKSKKRQGFVTIARLVPWKGIDLLIEIFKENKQQLTIIGDGPLYKEYKEKIKDIPNITMTGRLTNKEVIEYLQSSKAMILNSGYEGLPHVVIEAFQSGCNVLLSDVCGNPEIVQDNKNGLLFKYNDKESIKKAIKEIQNKDFSKEAKKSLHKFDWDKMIKKKLKILK